MPNPDLSVRDAAILGLIVKGLTNKEVAAKLNITAGTMTWHLNIQFARPNVTDRTPAAVAAGHGGLVNP
jgi:DNA-binding NarL/FixJ family response regulator